jgi:serine/threonine protein kinase
VKTMHPHLAKEAEFVAMFLDEARLAARIRHPNVVATLDIQQDAEGLFLVMEYVEGPSLSRLLKVVRASTNPSRPDAPAEPPPSSEIAAAILEEGRLPLEVALRIFCDTLAGLHAAHELTGPDGEPLNLIHRDMSPHNVLVGSDGIARITDFGVARAESRLASTRTGSVKGKVMYMAPEQVRSLPIDRRADIYAAGSVLFELLTGERLVRADSELAAMRMIVESDRQSPREVEPRVPEAISAVCMGALARDPEQRYATAAAFLEALEAAAAASGVTIAQPRAVAQVIRALGVHKPPEMAPASQSRPSTQSLLAPGSAVESQAPASAASAPAKLDTTPPSVGTHAAFASHSSLSLAPRRNRTGILLAVVSAMIFGGAVALFVVAQGGAGSGNGPASATPTLAPETPVTASPPPTVVPVEPASLATATATAQGSAAPSASTTSTAAAARTAPSRPGGTAGAKGFRPKEL